MEDLFNQFTRERQFIRNVSPRTLEAYQWAWKAFAPALSLKDHVSKADVLQRIEELRSGGLSPVSINTYLRSVSGTWQTVDASRGIYTLTWPDPVDSVTLSADDQTIAGKNQYGVATSGTRVEPCTVN